MTIKSEVLFTKEWHKPCLDLLKSGVSNRQVAKTLFGNDSFESRIRTFLEREDVKGYLSQSEDKKIKKFSEYEVELMVNKSVSMLKERQKIIVIADTQCKSEEDLSYMKHIGKFIYERKPDVIVHIGDHYDFPSLSSYDKGKSTSEGRRLSNDIKAGNTGFEYLNMYIDQDSSYNPRKVFCMGNHENRLDRYVDDNPELIGTLGTEMLPFEKYGWEVYDFLKPVEISGIFFVHYLANPMNGKPYGGNAMNILKTVGKSFVVGHKQCLDIAIRPTIDGKQQIGIINGACLTPDHKVLTADLRYIPLGDVKVGDEIVSVDEHTEGSNHRRFKTGKVLAHKIEKDVVYKVMLSDGTEFKVTDDHKWLVKTGSTYLWKETNQLRMGTRITKALDTWETLSTYDAGWLSGIYDGEGTYGVRASGNSVCAQMAVYQKEGLVLNKMKQVMNDIGFLVNSSVATNRNCVEIKVQGGVKNIAKLLGMLRPVRLLNKFKPEHLGRLKTTDAENPTVVSIEKIGDMDVVRIHVDEATMVVDGFVHHNCYPFDERYKGYQGNNHFRGLTVLNDVRDGFGVPMFVSLDSIVENGV